MNNSFVILIIALFPLVTGILLIQVNPFNALIIRGVLGALAALIEALLGAADVALTEALVGTLLAITLYAIAVRSSMVMRLAVLEASLKEVDSNFKSFISDLRRILTKYYLRLEFVPYSNLESLYQALAQKEVHGYCVLNTDNSSYQTTIRVKRLYDLINPDLNPENAQLIYKDPTDLGDKPA